MHSGTSQVIILSNAKTMLKFRIVYVQDATELLQQKKRKGENRKKEKKKITGGNITKENQTSFFFCLFFFVSVYFLICKTILIIFPNEGRLLSFSLNSCSFF